MKSEVYARLDAGTIYLGNDLWERQWSNFLGNTIAICSKADGMEWAQPSPEFCIDSGGAKLGHLELGYTEWSDTRDTLSGGVLARHRNDSFELEIHSLIFHGVPGMLRRMRLFNVSSVPQTLASFAMESLNISKNGAKVMHSNFEKASESFNAHSEEAALALLYPNGGLIMGIHGGGQYKLFAPEPRQVSLCTKEGRVMAPGTVWVLPDTYMMPFAGTLDEGVRKQLADFLIASGEYTHWETERERDKALPEPI